MVRRCEIAHPCPATSLLSRHLFCRLEIRSLHNQVMQRRALPMGGKVPLGWGLAFLQVGSIFQRSQFCPRLDWDIPISPWEVSLFLTPNGHDPQQSHRVLCASPHRDSHHHKAPADRESTVPGGDMPLFRVTLGMCDSLDMSQTSSLQTQPREAHPPDAGPGRGQEMADNSKSPRRHSALI